MGGHFRSRVQTQSECCSKQNKIHSYPDEDQKKVFAANRHWFRPEFRNYWPLFHLNVQELSFGVRVAKSRWGDAKPISVLLVGFEAKYLRFEAKAKNFKMCSQGQGRPQELHLWVLCLHQRGLYLIGGLTKFYGKNWDKWPGKLR